MEILKKIETRFRKVNLFNWQRKNIPVNVSLDKRIIFIHIPKNAGSSITSALDFQDITHANVVQVRKQLGKAKFRAYYKFCFVRNPFDRFVSLYNYARMEESIYHSSVYPERSPFGKHMDYDILKNASLFECANYLLEGKLEHDKTWFHWQPQVNWLRNERGDIEIDFVGRFENLESDFKKIARRLDLQIILPHINPTTNTKKDYRTYYDDRTKQIISDYYEEDLKLFEYEF